MNHSYLSSQALDRVGRKPGPRSLLANGNVPSKQSALTRPLAGNPAPIVVLSSGRWPIGSVFRRREGRHGANSTVESHAQWQNQPSGSIRPNSFVITVELDRVDLREFEKTPRPFRFRPEFSGIGSNWLRRAAYRGTSECIRISRLERTTCIPLPSR